MRHKRIITGTLAGLAIAALPALADDRLDDLDGPMRGFDSVAEVPAALAELPDPRRIGEPDPDAIREIAKAPPPVGGEARAEFDRAVRGAFASELEDGVREGFIADVEFEHPDGSNAVLAPREDYFHEEEGEDVDLEDEFNDDPDG
jgi:hypothetical protein